MLAEAEEAAPAAEAEAEEAAPGVFAVARGLPAALSVLASLLLLLLLLLLPELEQHAWATTGTPVETWSAADDDAPKGNTSLPEAAEAVG